MNASSKKFNIFLSLAVILVVIGAGIVAYDYWRNNQQQPVIVSDVVLPDVDNNLTAPEKEIYEKRLLEAQKMWDELDSEAATSFDKFDIQMYLGAQYFGLGKFNLAKQAYEQAANLRNDNPTPYTALFVLYSTAGEFNLAKQAIQQALQIEPYNSDAWLKYITLEQEKLQAGKDFIKILYIDALKQTNSKADVLVAYARFLENSGEVSLAIDQWQEVLKQQPDNELYKQELAKLLEK